MRGIIIAAGLGTRLRPLTKHLPKCMLPLAGRPLLHHTMAHMRSAGCNEFVVIVGFGAEKIDAGGATIVVNEDFADNNILHSLMCASDFLNGPVMCSYSDIWVEPKIHRDLTLADGDICLAVDSDWMPYYEGRSEHPLSEAENVFYDSNGSATSLGKHLNPSEAGNLWCGEFLGLWRLSSRGCKIWREKFFELKNKIGYIDPFQQSEQWQKSYITDYVQELIDQGNLINTALTKRGWAEIDTNQDYERLETLAEKQNLHTLCEIIK
jgi:choline kinase